MQDCCITDYTSSHACAVGGVQQTVTNSDRHAVETGLLISLDHHYYHIIFWISL